jgi:hypothetical protein
MFEFQNIEIHLRTLLSPYDTQHALLSPPSDVTLENNYSNMDLARSHAMMVGRAIESSIASP